MYQYPSTLRVILERFHLSWEHWEQRRAMFNLLKIMA